MAVALRQVAAANQIVHSLEDWKGQRSAKWLHQLPSLWFSDWCLHLHLVLRLLWLSPPPSQRSWALQALALLAWGRKLKYLFGISSYDGHTSGSVWVLQGTIAHLPICREETVEGSHSWAAPFLTSQNVFVLVIEMATILNFFFLPWGIKPFLFHNGTLWFTLRALQLCSSWMNGVGVKGWRKKETITGVGFFLPQHKSEQKSFCMYVFWSCWTYLFLWHLNDGPCLSHRGLFATGAPENSGAELCTRSSAVASRKQKQQH